MAPETNPFGTSENMHALAPDQAPILMHPLGTSENAYTHALAPDQASVLTLPLGTLGTSENARSYTRTSPQFVSTEEEIEAIAMPIEREGELGKRH